MALPRYYISAVVGSGTEADPYRPRVAALTDNWRATLPSAPDGRPASTWCLVQAGDVPDDPDVTPLLDLRQRLGDLSLIERARIRRALDEIGVTFSDADDPGDVIERVGQRLEPTYKVSRG